MSDLFDDKSIGPMLFGREAEPFDDPRYIFELKLDGERCLAYLSAAGTELYNRRHKLMDPHVPELADLHRQAKAKCILDGELIVLKDGAPDFYEIMRRSLTADPIKIGRMARQAPAAFTAFDILYYDGQRVTGCPLTERKQILRSVFEESERFAFSRDVEENGVALFELARAQNLEGVVAKRKDSLYQIGARTTDWLKIKNLKDDDFVICGYIKSPDSPHVVSLILGAYQQDQLIYQGRVLLGCSRAEFALIAKQKKTPCPFDEAEQNAIYIKPTLICTVRHMRYTHAGGIRQPAFKGLRLDKTP